MRVLQIVILTGFAGTAFGRPVHAAHDITKFGSHLITSLYCPATANGVARITDKRVDDCSTADVSIYFSEGIPKRIEYSSHKADGSLFHKLTLAKDVDSKLFVAMIKKSNSYLNDYCQGSYQFRSYINQRINENLKSVKAACPQSFSKDTQAN